MAGTHFEIKIEKDEVSAGLERLLRAGGDLEPAFRDIGEYLLISHRERFENQVSPDGDPWAPLSPDYQATKRKNPDKILILESDLMDTLAYDARPDELEFGTNRIYGATHQFGREDANIPARPFIGVSEADESQVLIFLEDHLTGAWEG